MDGWMDVCVDGWIDGWMDGGMDVCEDEWMDGWMDDSMDGWIEGWMILHYPTSFFCMASSALSGTADEADKWFPHPDGLFGGWRMTDIRIIRGWAG